MCKYHEEWDDHADTIAGLLTQTRTDKQAAKRKEPQRMVVPTARAQVHTLVSFLFLFFQQNQYAFNFHPTEKNDYKIRELVEKLVDRDCRKSNWATVLYQFLLDCARFNIGVIEHSWEETVRHLPVETMTVGSFFGATWNSADESTEPVVTFQGNKLYNVSPYRFFPDPSVPLTRLNDGEYCGVEEEMSRTALYQLQNEGVIAGMEHVKDFKSEDWNKFYRSRKRNRFVDSPEERPTTDAQEMVTVLRHQVKIIPSKFEIDGEPLGPEDYPVTWIVWVANDKRVIRAEPANYLHGKFTFDVAQFDPDIHEFITQGLCGVVHKLQETISWFINSHILSVRRNLDHQLLYDPKYIDPDKLSSRASMIPLRKSIDRARIADKVLQLQVGDVTGKHMENAQQLIELMYMVTGINENATGSVGKGRRSATERGAANQGASARLRTIGANIFTQGLGPLAESLMINLRQGLDREHFDRFVGAPSGFDPMEAQEHEEAWTLFKSSPRELLSGCDFFVLDTTDPNQKMYLAQALSDLFKVIMSVPDAAAAFDIDPSALYKDIMELRGATNLDKYSLRERLARQQQQVQTPPINEIGNRPGPANAPGQGETQPVAAVGG